MPLFTLFLVAFFGLIQGWSQYASPIVMSKPNQEGVYEFEIAVKRGLTMVYNPSQHVELAQGYFVDYNPKHMTWTLRNPSTLAECSATLPVNQSDLSGVILGDGLHRRIITVNGLSPHMGIVVPFGAKVILRLHNTQPMERASLHVHGIDKQNRWFADGVPYLQQCPVESMTTFSYSLIADTMGSHWYHGHSTYERSMGFFGSFIVKNPDETTILIDGSRIVMSRDYVAMLQDVPFAPIEEIVAAEFMVNKKWLKGYDKNGKNDCYQCRHSYDGSTTGGCVAIQSILVNGKGWHNQSEVISIPKNLPLETFVILPTQHIKIRLIHAGVHNALMVSLEDHKLTIVATDGVEVKPLQVDMLIIHAGERYDIVIKGYLKPKKTIYRFIVETMDYTQDDGLKIAPVYGLANLEYEGVDGKRHNSVDYNHSKCTSKNRCVVFNCAFKQFPPGVNFGCLHVADLDRNVPNGDLEIIKHRVFNDKFQEIFYNTYDQDGYPYKGPHGFVHKNEERLSKVSTPCDPNCDNRVNDCSCFLHKRIGLNDIVQMTIYNLNDSRPILSSHPFHIHGYHFYVVKMGFPTYDKNGKTLACNHDLNCNAKTVSLTA
ncbi:hypothetical protein L596_021039 [Steinernema carpocapsae]|uniref:Plastocyanin-like domain-containing protein n=1 Tax=Steinernema carpocapsae TaxID=34508 RepID=A0A4V6XW08_STECR|nr:hypothetical protein L596_021039 [Steinernema carpocapsae]